MQPNRGHVLILSDDRERADRVAGWVRQAGEVPVVLCGEEKSLLADGADHPKVDLVITDLNLSDRSSRILLEQLIAGRLFALVPHLHFQADPERGEGLRRRDTGGDVWGFPPDPVTFRSWVRLGAETGRLRKELRRQSVLDLLTRTLNRRHFLVRLEEEFARARRHRHSLSLVLFQLEGLQPLNHAHGAREGDQALRRAAEVLRGRVRKEDVLGRVGDEVFGVLLPANSFRGAAIFASNARAALEEDLAEAFQTPGGRLRVSAGISSFPANPAVRTLDDLLRASENAVAEARRRGGNRVFLDPQVLEHERPLVLVADQDPKLLEMAEDLLALDDYQVLRCATAERALQSIRFRRPDLVILDLQMEDGQGRPLVERVRTLYATHRFPIIGLCRDPQSEPELAGRLGVDRFVTKPFSLSLLRSMVRDLLEAYAAQDAQSES